MGFQPPNSPDLNPIENVFSLMKRFVRRAAPSTIEELRQSVLDAWESIDLETLQKLFDSMSRRMEAVIRLKGKRTGY